MSVVTIHHAKTNLSRLIEKVSGGRGTYRAWLETCGQTRSCGSNKGETPTGLVERQIARGTRGSLSLCQTANYPIGSSFLARSS